MPITGIVMARKMVSWMGRSVLMGMSGEDVMVSRRASDREGGRAETEGGIHYVDEQSSYTHSL